MSTEVSFHAEYNYKFKVEISSRWIWLIGLASFGFEKNAFHIFNMFASDWDSVRPNVIARNSGVQVIQFLVWDKRHLSNLLQGWHTFPYTIEGAVLLGLPFVLPALEEEPAGFVFPSLTLGAGTCTITSRSCYTTSIESTYWTMRIQQLSLGLDWTLLSCFYIRRQSEAPTFYGIYLLAQAMMQSWHVRGVSL